MYRNNRSGIYTASGKVYKLAFCQYHFVIGLFTFLGIRNMLFVKVSSQEAFQDKINSVEIHSSLSYPCPRETQVNSSFNYSLKLNKSNPTREKIAYLSK